MDKDRVRGIAALKNCFDFLIMVKFLIEAGVLLYTLASNAETFQLI